MIWTILSAIAAQTVPAAPPVAVPSVPQAVVRTPSPTPERTPEEKFRLAMRNLFDLVAKPSASYNPYVYFTDKTRLWLVTTQPGGLADAKMGEGEAARGMLEALFGPDRARDGFAFRFGEPQVEMDGAFARGRMTFTATKATESPLCGFAYIEAALTPPGPWAKVADQGQWQFTQITVTMEKFRKCEP